MIRLQRIGRKHEPAFRLVLTDSKNSTKSGKFLEILGNYDSRRGEKAEFKTDRVSYWMSQGVKATDTVHNLLIDKKIILDKKVNKLPKKTPIKSVDDGQKSTEKSENVKASSESTHEAIETEAEIVEETEIKSKEVPTEKTEVEETIA